MASPIGSSTQFCCSKFGFSISDISYVSPRFSSQQFFRSLDPCVVCNRVLLELIFVRNGSLGLPSDFIYVDSVEGNISGTDVCYYRATACNAMHSIAVAILSVCQTRVLRQN